MRVLTVLLFAAVLAGCFGSDEGPCVHSYLEPIVTVRSVTESGTGKAIPDVIVYTMTLDSVGIEPQFLSGTSRNIEVTGDTVRAHVPFGFGSDPGRYRFTVEAPGYVPQVVEYDADYGVFEGGCPSYNDEGIDVDIVLVPR